MTEIRIPLPDAPKVYVVEMTESEYKAVYNVMACYPSVSTDDLYDRMYEQMCDAE